MEQLIIFLLFVVASIVSSIIQKKKQREEEEAARRDLAPRSGSPPAQPPVTRWPRSAQEWQEQLRKMLEEKAPPVLKPIIVPEKSAPPPSKTPIPVKLVRPEEAEGEGRFTGALHESATAYQRAANLGAKVEERLQALDQTPALRRSSLPARRRGARAGRRVIQNLRGRPSALRDAFIASLIFSAPKALEESRTENYR